MKTVSAKDFAAAAAGYIAERIQACLERGEFCVVGLCGGSTPRGVYALLAGKDLPWERVFFTFGDERCVPPASDSSNYRMARESLLAPAKVPEQNVLRIKGEMEPVAAAREYENQLAQLWQKTSKRTHDIVVLGMGADGHTASLFPGSCALGETQRAVVENWVETQKAWRITLTYPTLNASGEIVFLVNDPAKVAIVEEILNGKSDAPAAKIDQTKAVWVVGS